MFNIITTNKNNIAIAPKYIIKKNKAKNSFSNKNNNIDDAKKLVTKNKTEWRGFLEIITIEALPNNNAHIK